MKKCFGYVRVSTVKQGDGVSIEVQREAIERYAKQHDIAVTNWFEETITAAKKGRPQFNQMIAELRRGRADGIIFHKIDRSARNFADWARIGELSDAGFAIHFVTESLDFQSRGGRMAADIQAVVAADYIRNLREESIKGQKGRLKQGLYPYTAPVGYLDAGKGKPKTIDPERAPLVVSVFERYATGQHSYETLASYMREEGLTNRGGTPISKTGVEHILRNPFYTGVIRIRKSGETYPGIHKPIISTELFERAKAVRTGRKRKARVIHNFLYRGLFRCALCDRAMIGEKQKGRVYYRCHTSGCASPTLREDTIDAHARSYLQQFSLSKKDTKTLKTVLSSRIRQHIQRSPNYTATIELKKTKERLSRLTDMSLDGLIDDETYVNKRAELCAAQSKWQELAQHHRSADWYLKNFDELLEKTNMLRQMFETSTLEQCRDILIFASSNRTVGRENLIIEPPKWHMELKSLVCALSSAPDTPSSRTYANLIDLVVERVSNK
ncbi:MAG: recombinase family protein [Pseudomonadota bacterium]